MMATPSQEIMNVFAWGRGDCCARMILVDDSKMNLRGTLQDQSNSKDQEKSNNDMVDEDTNLSLDESNQNSNFHLEIQENSWDEINDVTRRLLFHGHQIFSELNEVTTDIPIDTLHEKSKSLRNALLDCVISINNMPISPENEQLSQNLRRVATIWHLIEIIGFLSTSYSIVIVSWINKYFPRQSPEMRSSLLDAYSSGTDEESLWELVFDCIVRGDLLYAWTILKNLPRFQQGLYEKDRIICQLYTDIRSLLLSMPWMRDILQYDTSDAAKEDLAMWTKSRASTGMEYKTRFTQWHMKVEQFLEERNDDMAYFSHSVDGTLKQMLSLLCGNLESWTACLDSELSENSWAHLTAGLILYCKPAKNKHDISELVSRCMNWAQVPEDDFERVFIDVFSQNYAKVVQTLHAEIGDRWVDCHLTEILARGHKIESVSISSNIVSGMSIPPESFLLGDLEMDMREYFIIQYACQVGFGGRRSWRNAHSPIHWKLATDYLVTLRRPVTIPSIRDKIPLGFPYVEMIVDSLYPETDKFCRNVISLCKRLGLPFDHLIRERVVHWWRSKGGGTRDENGIRQYSFANAVSAINWARLVGDHEVLNGLLARVFDCSNTKSLDLLVNQLGISLETNFGGKNMEFLSHYKALYKDLEAASKMLSKCFETTDGLAQPNSTMLENVWRLRDAAVRNVCKILASNAVPIRFYEPLLAKVFFWEWYEGCPDEVIAVVELNPPCLTYEEASVLINCLEESTLWKKRVCVSETLPLADLSLIRVVLLQCLARAHMMHPKEIPFSE